MTTSSSGWPPEQDMWTRTLIVCERGGEAFVRAIQIAETLRSERSRDHMMYGLGRRLRFLHHGLREILSTAPPNRTEPLDGDQEVRLSLHLNSFYLHIRGCLDNLAWCVAHELGLLGTVTRDENTGAAGAVNLFGQTFLAELEPVAPELAGIIRQKASWNVDLKSVRDPVAHRIPIYAVPSTVSDDAEVDRYLDVSARFRAALDALDVDQAQVLFRERDGIGTYRPWFAHTPTAARPLYPQLPDDMTVLLDLVESTVDFFAERSARGAGVPETA